jgi:hypothetical protein
MGRGKHWKTEKEKRLADGREGGREGGRSQIIRRRESLILYSTVNTLWGMRGTGPLTNTVYKCTKEHKTTKQRGGEESIYYVIKVIMRRGLGY